MTKDSLREVLESIAAKVSDQDEGSLEIVGKDFPLRTLVTVTDYYIQLGTMIQATGQGFRPGSKSRFYPFLNAMNASTNLTKITAETDCADEDSSWLLMARAMIVSGSESTEYDSESFSNILTLWHQDIANLISMEGPYTITAMLES